MNAETGVGRLEASSAGAVLSVEHGANAVLDSPRNRLAFVIEEVDTGLRAFGHVLLRNSRAEVVPASKSLTGLGIPPKVFEVGPGIDAERWRGINDGVSLESRGQGRVDY